MKKTFTKICVCVLSFVLAIPCFIGCGGSNWNASSITLKTPGEVLSVKGFVAETENYVYFINGKATSEGDNEFGKPVKGALVVADKNDLTKSEVVVPKLFVATDFDSGLFIDGGYVYYATSSTDKNSSGETAREELVFARTKLDGTDTSYYATVPGLATEHRFVSAEDGVHVVYYDGTARELIDYSIATKSKTVIAKRNEEADKESLDVYRFVDATSKDAPVVFYSTTVYADKYDSAREEIEGEEYARLTQEYNKAYAYKIGDAKTDSDFYGVVVFNGAEYKNPLKITLGEVRKGYMFYTVADATELTESLKTKNYAIAVKDFYAKKAGTLLKLTDKVTDSTIFNSLAISATDASSGVFFLDGAFIMRTDIVSEDYLQTSKTVAIADNAQNLLFTSGDYIYYTDENSNLFRIKYNNVDASKEEQTKYQKVSPDAITSDWYAPVVVNGYVMFADGSSLGRSYVTAVKESAEVKPVDEKAETKTYFVDSKLYVGCVEDADLAGRVATQIANITPALEDGKIVLDTDKDGKIITPLQMKEITTARTAYNALTDAQKALVSAEDLKNLEVYEEGLRLSQLIYDKLNNFDQLTKSEKQAKKTDFEAVKAEIENLKVSEKFEYSSVRALIAGNLNWYYQIATEFFAE